MHGVEDSRSKGRSTASRAERRTAARTRRNRLVLGVAVLCSVGVVAAWFPASALLHQRAQLAAASAELNRLDRQNAALRHQEKELRTPATIARVAEQQYDVVPTGVQAYQVLPPSGTTGGSGALAPTTTATAAGTGTGTGGSGSALAGSRDGGVHTDEAPGSSGSFFGRVLETLEFWR